MIMIMIMIRVNHNHKHNTGDYTTALGILIPQQRGIRFLINIVEHQHWNNTDGCEIRITS